MEVGKMAYNSGPLEAIPEKEEANMNKKNLQACFQRGIAYAKFCVAGAIGGVALVNTVAMIMGSAATQSAENIAIAAGGLLAAAVIKILHIV
jgi:hypothetical protein